MDGRLEGLVWPAQANTTWALILRMLLAGGGGALGNFLDICQVSAVLCNSQTHPRGTRGFVMSSQVASKSAHPKIQAPPRPGVAIISAFIHTTNWPFTGSTSPDKGSKVPTWEGSRRNSSKPNAILCHSDLLKCYRVALSHCRNGIFAEKFGTQTDSESS